MYENKVRVREYDGPGMVYRFLGAAGFAAWLVCLALSAMFLTGCKGGGTPTTPPPPPPQNYEPLGTVHWLKGAQGETDMWARLPVEPNPPRGSTLLNGGGGTVVSVVKVEVGIKNPGAKFGAYITGYWSHDGSARDEEVVQIGECLGGECGSPKVVEAVIRQPENRVNYRYLLISGTQGVIPKDKRTGTTSFLLDYR